MLYAAFLPLPLARWVGGGWQAESESEVCGGKDRGLGGDWNHLLLIFFGVFVLICDCVDRPTAA